MITQLGGAVPQSRENQMRFATMKPPTRKRRPRLDEQDALVAVVEKMRTQLIGEAPAPATGRHVTVLALKASTHVLAVPEQ